jgi:hypothetical protein
VGFLESELALLQLGAVLKSDMQRFLHNSEFVMRRLLKLLVVQLHLLNFSAQLSPFQLLLQLAVSSQFNSLVFFYLSLNLRSYPNDFALELHQVHLFF